MIETFDDLTKGAFSYNFDQLEPISDMVSFLYPVITLFVVKAIIDKSLELGRFYFACILC